MYISFMKKSNPADYPQFAFRLSKQDKEEIMELIEEIHEMLNERRDDKTPVITKNQIVVSVLKDGLLGLKKRKPKLPLK